jgi:hypothetical protein
MREDEPTLLKGLSECVIRTNRTCLHFKNYFRKKPLIGGRFGSSGYSLASYSFVLGGLDQVMYQVILDKHEFVISTGDTKAEALHLGRQLLESLGDFNVASMASKFAAEVEAEEALARAARQSHMERPSEKATQSRRVPRRRTKLFEAFGGKCFYCQCELELEGRWHIEHKLPKALGGTNDPDNLVPACVPCNSKKRDKTDTEFMAERIERLERPVRAVA